jgi:hypothetical protein
MKKKESIQTFLKKPQLAWLIILLGVCIALIAHGIRDTPQLPGLESQYNQRIASSLSLPIENDPMQVHETKIHVNLYHGILALARHAPLWVLKGISILGSVLVLIVLRKLLRELGISHSIINSMLGILILIPVFTYYSIVLSVIPLVTVLMLASILFLRKKRLRWLGYILASLIALFGIKMIGIYLFVLLAYAIYSNKMPIFYYVVLIQGTLFGITAAVSMTPDTFSLPLMNGTQVLSEIIAEFGGLRSIGVMTITLFIYGFVRNFSDNKHRNLQFIFALALVSLLFFEYRIVYVAAIVVALYAAIGINLLLERKWHSQDLKQFTLIIIFCGLLFTNISYLKQVQGIEPNAIQVEALSWLSSQEKGIVLAHPKVAPYIQNIGDQPVMIDAFHYEFGLLNDIDSIFSSRDLITTSRLLRKYNIKYIYLDTETKNELWNSDSDGLQFLFSNENYFKRLYYVPNNLEIWEFKG